MQTEKIKELMAMAGTDAEPSNAQIAGAMQEGIDIVVSIATSLERLAVAAEYENNRV